MRRHCFVFFLILACFFNPRCPLFGQEQPKDGLKNAIWLYEHENYEEALAVLKKVYQENPTSAFAAYYLGITYKQLQDFLSAKGYLLVAVTLEPKINNAILELIDVLYQRDEFEEANKWLAAAESESLVPAQTAFLKGLVLAREGKDINGAIQAFDRAAALDKGLENAVDFQKAMLQLQAQKLSAARDIFQKIITKEPYSDMAAFADEYLNALTRKEDAGRPFHGSCGAGLAYDDNVFSKPRDKTLGIDVAPKKDWRSVYTFEEDYRYKPVDWFGIRSAYSLYFAKQFDAGYYDTMSHDLSVQPGIYLGRMSFAFPMHYNLMSLNHSKYLQVFGYANLNNFMVGRRQMAQTLLQYSRNKYAWAETNDDERRRGGDYLASLGWYYFFGKNQEGFLNLRYAVDYDEAKGCNGKYLGNRFSIVAAIPLTKRVRMSFGGDYYNEDFRKTNSVYNQSRIDNAFTLSDLFAIEIFKNADLEIQYTYVKNFSTISVYEYTRDILSSGFKYKF